MGPQRAFELANELWGVSEILRHTNPRLLMFRSDGGVTVIGSPLQNEIEWPKGVESWPLPEKEWVSIPLAAWKEYHNREVMTPNGQTGTLVGSRGESFMVLVQDPHGEESIVLCKKCEVQE